MNESKQATLAKVAAIICEATCGLTSKSRSREAAQALLDNGFLRGECGVRATQHIDFRPTLSKDASPMKSEGEGMLLPCPFCGGRAEAGRTYNAETTLFKVQCMSCPAAMKGYDQSVADAIDGWNTRAAPRPHHSPAENTKDSQ